MSSPSERDVLAHDESSIGLFGWAREFVRTWGPAIVAVLVIRSAIAEPFRIPSGSMVPTLQIGDHILVSKLTYGLRVPFTTFEVVGLGEPERGDVIVFRYPENPDIDYIKRIVGVPGDSIEVRDDVVFINGERAVQTFKDRYKFQDRGCHAMSLRRSLETFGEEAHEVLHSDPGSRPLQANWGPKTVPQDSYFMMGDNRHNSRDSRMWGFVERDQIKGKAIWVWLSYDTCDGNPVMGDFRLRFRTDRFGKRII
ncbi:MAG: signal peptidase I [Myxococcota bacterium]|nr:signal peptidase I [Myxococcota bacterium]